MPLQVGNAVYPPRIHSIGLAIGLRERVQFRKSFTRHTSVKEL
jgi:hypothetical protein